MLIALALLLNLVGAALVYLASARQRLLASSLSPVAALIAFALMAGGLASWIVEAGRGAGIAASLTTWMLTWVALPYASWWHAGADIRRERAG